jgi:hypothetical protein
MRRVLESVEKKTVEFAKAPFFTFLRDTSIDPRQRLAFAPYAAHFEMTFADLCSLVLREQPPKDQYQELVNTHTWEDDGHWRWFLTDLETLGHDKSLAFSDALKFVWSDLTVRMRMLNYNLIRLGLGADSIRKLVLIYCIESTFRVTIKHVSMVAEEFTKLTGKKLIFFGTHHSGVEDTHNLLNPAVRRMVEGIGLETSVSSELSSMVDEVFGLFIGFMDELLECARRGQVLARPID